MLSEYNYENWKDETNLAKICSSLLDNADMNIEFQSIPLSIRLTFFIIGSDVKVVFDCVDITELKLLKDFSDLPFHLVLEVNVSEPKKTRSLDMSDNEFSMLEHSDYAWNIIVLPEVDLDIKCLSFKWCLKKATEQELNYRK